MQRPYNYCPNYGFIVKMRMRVLSEMPLDSQITIHISHFPHHHLQQPQLLL